MKNKTFTLILSLSSFFLGVIAAGCIIKGNWIIPIIAMVLFTVLISTLKLFIKEKTVMTDERIEKISGKAAKITYIIATYLLAVASIIFAAISKNQPEFFWYSAITSISCFGMLIIYSIIFSYLNKK